MRAKSIYEIPRKALIIGVLCLSAARLASGLESAASAFASASAWEASPYRNFGPGQAVWTGRAVLRDEAEDPALAASLGAELRRLAVELHERQGWRVPVIDGDPIRILIARKDAGGVHRLAARSVESGRLVSPAIQVDATGLSNRQIVREVARLYAAATLSAYGLRDRSFLSGALAEYLAGPGGEEEREAARVAAAAPAVELWGPGASLGRFYVEEFARDAGGTAALRAVWEKAAEARAEPLEVLLKAFADATGAREDALLLRFAARLYATFET